MQIARLFEIVYLLLSNEKLTAGELAARFEVSPRTIYRDIDALSAAGIPVYATKGKGGGIHIMPSYVLRNAMLSDGDKRNIMAALQSLSVAQVPDAGAVLLKLGALFRQDMQDWIRVDFSDWGLSSADKFALIREAIFARRPLSFEYYNARGEKSKRIAMPVQLWFKHRAWYLKAFCIEKNAPRLFKLSRMRAVAFENIPGYAMPDDIADKAPPEAEQQMPVVQLALQIGESAAYRVYDEFDEAQWERTADGGFLLAVDMIEDEWLYGYLLTFGSALRVNAPTHVQEGLKRRAVEIVAAYDKEE